MSSRALRFGAFTLLSSELRLLRGADELPVGQRALQVLSLLVHRPGELVSKDELLDTVWRGLVVEEADLHVQVSLLRKAVGADAVVTVPGRGYRCSLPADAFQTPPPPVAAPTAPPRRLSVLVLPLVETGASPGQACLADAITDARDNSAGCWAVGWTTAAAG